ncbi:MAG: hypothetical protein ABGX78_12755 [Microbacterium sp.]|uniref:hypothetical protein n=1 Tax=Microbacterium sp. TaxID=51671 RepID=UPI0032429DDB
MNNRAWVCAAVVVGAVVGAELVVRANLDARLGSATEDLAVQGVSVSSGTTPAIWQVLTGRVDLRVAIDSAAVATLAACRFDSPIDVRIEPTALSIAVEMPYQGTTFPAEVSFQPEETSDGWRLVPAAVIVAGFEVPPALLSRAGGAVPAALIDGITMPNAPDAMSVTSVSLAPDELVLSVTAPASASGAGGIAGPLSGCID